MKKSVSFVKFMVFLVALTILIPGANALPGGGPGNGGQGGHHSGTQHGMKPLVDSTGTAYLVEPDTQNSSLLTAVDAIDQIVTLSFPIMIAPPVLSTDESVLVTTDVSKGNHGATTSSLYIMPLPLTQSSAAIEVQLSGTIMSHPVVKNNLIYVITGDSSNSQAQPPQTYLNKIDFTGTVVSTVQL